MYRHSMKLIKGFAVALIVTIVSTACVSLYIWFNSQQIIDNRCSDLQILAASDNCLSEASYKTFKELLNKSSNSWLEFHVESDDKIPADAIIIKKYNPNSREPEGDNLIGFKNATAEGEPIYVSITGHVMLSLPWTENRIDIPYTQSYVVVGRRFYKDKTAEIEDK